MHKFAASLRKATDSVKCIGNITAQTTGLRRGRLNEVTFGCTDTPADASFRVQIQRCTAIGTGTSKTPKPLDNADAAATTVATHLCSADPTLTSNEELLDVGINQRSTFRWVAPPDGELWWPATNLSGLSANLSAASILTWAASMVFEE